MATIYTPAIGSGNLVLNLNSQADSWHVVDLNAAINAGGISVTNPPAASNSCEVRVIFVPSGGVPRDIPVTAWTGSGLSSIVWEGDYDSTAVRTTPTIVYLMSWNQGTSWIARQNASAGVRVEAVTSLPGTPDVDTVYVVYSA